MSAATQDARPQRPCCVNAPSLHHRPPPPPRRDKKLARHSVCTTCNKLILCGCSDDRTGTTRGHDVPCRPGRDLPTSATLLTRTWDILSNYATYTKINNYFLMSFLSPFAQKTRWLSLIFNLTPLIGVYRCAHENRIVSWLGAVMASRAEGQICDKPVTSAAHA